MAITERVLSPVAELREGEGRTALMMFAYSFLAMSAYNVIKPITRSKFISDLGADNLPYVALVSGILIGFLMAGYSWLLSRLPRRWGLPITQLGMAGVLAVFWFLFQTDATWVSVAFYINGLILGVLLISQFWTLANIVYDPRQAKRLFGFIGGGAPLGGIAGSAFATAYATRIGSTNLLIPSTVCMVLSALLVTAIIGRERVDPGAAPAGTAPKKKDEKGVSAAEALHLLRQSKHLQIIALVISFAAVGAAIIDQQLNMAAAAAKGSGATDSITSFLATVQLWTSSIGFIIQVWLTSKIHRYLGIGFALMILPVSLGTTAVIMLLNAALWAPSLARILDQSLRYTVDKTTREILFLPLPSDIKLKAKSFVDVTVDRAAKATGALLLVVLVKPWGLHLNWQQLSYASLAMTVAWIFMALRARRGYLEAFRHSIERRDVRPEEVRLSGADLSTIESLVQELSHPDAERVVYAIDVLESLEKRHLVTPLLLYHESPRVRTRALAALGQVRSDIASRWDPQIRRLLGDPDPGVRSAAVGALGAIQNESTATIVRPLLDDPDPRIRVTAAVALAASDRAEDRARAGTVFSEIIADTSDAARPARRDAAAALRQVRHADLRAMLMPLLYDPAQDVAEQALASVRDLGPVDALFVPALVTLLRNRQLKGPARDVLIGYGEPVVDALAFILADRDEDVWIRRHIPATLARISSQKSVDALIAALGDPDGFLRFKAIAGLQTLRHTDAPLTFHQQPIERATLAEGRRYFTYLSLYHNLFERGGLPADTMLARALTEKMNRSLNRAYLLLEVLYPWRDIAAARWTLEHGDPRSRASASEYLDNLLTGPIRKQIMPALEDLPREEKVRRGNVLLRTRPRDVEESLLQLINDDDEVVAASAIDLVAAQQRWSLAEDIEHVLAHRDARDWFVFEAASWALAERRLSAERRRELWREPLPAAALAARIRALPLFGAVSVDELFRIAGTGRQVRHDPGRVLLQEGLVSPAVHILLDGQVILTRQGEAPSTVTAPAALGLDEALQGLPAAVSARAMDLVVTLAISLDEFRTLLADNTDLVRGLFATLSEGAGPNAGMPVMPTGAAAELAQLADGGLSPLEKALALQRVPIFSRIHAAEMLDLAQITRTVPIAAGSRLFEASAGAALWVVLSGELTLEDDRGNPAGAAHGGDVLGLGTLLTGAPIGRAADGARAGIALRIDREEFFELMEGRPALLQQFFGALFRGIAQRAGV
jgi:AAA family ATP:ADP antiporter